MSHPTISASGPAPREEGHGLWAWVRSLDAQQEGAEAGTAKFCKASVRHVARHGVCLVLSWRPELQDLLSIELLGSSRNPSHPLLARVAHTRPSSTGGWVTACAYVTPPGEGNLPVAEGPRPA